MTKSLVTGGSGFIGSNLVDYLKEQGHEVIVVEIDLPTTKNSMENLHL